MKPSSLNDLSVSLVSEDGVHGALWGNSFTDACRMEQGRESEREVRKSEGE